MNGYLLDMNVVSELRKTKPHGGVVAWIGNQHPNQLFISAVTIGELQAGVEHTRQQDLKKAEEIEEWINAIMRSQQVLAMDATCFRVWAKLMDGKPDSLLEDGMIAATAKVHSLIVASRNEKDFSQLDVKLINPFKKP
jgi:hypothetical protein